MLSGCNNADTSKTTTENKSSFDLAVAKKEIEEANRNFMDLVAKGDSVGLANAYTTESPLATKSIKFRFASSISFLATVKSKLDLFSVVVLEVSALLQLLKREKPIKRLEVNNEIFFIFLLVLKFAYANRFSAFPFLFDFKKTIHKIRFTLRRVLKKFLNLQIRTQISNLQINDNQTIRLKNQYGG